MQLIMESVQLAGGYVYCPRPKVKAAKKFRWQLIVLIDDVAFYKWRQLPRKCGSSVAFLHGNDIVGQAKIKDLHNNKRQAGHRQTRYANYSHCFIQQQRAFALFSFYLFIFFPIWPITLTTQQQAKSIKNKIFALLLFIKIKAAAAAEQKTEI